MFNAEFVFHSLEYVHVPCSIVLGGYEKTPPEEIDLPAFLPGAAGFFSVDLSKKAFHFFMKSEGILSLEKLH